METKVPIADEQVDHPFTELDVRRPSAATIGGDRVPRRILATLGVAGVITFGAAAWTQDEVWVRLVHGLAVTALGSLIVVYLVVMAAKALIVTRALMSRQRRVIDLRFVDVDRPGGWPSYTILVPLYHEGSVVSALVTSLAALDYPVDRLQILLLLERDDTDTESALAAIALPDHMEVVVVPAGRPTTKPRACNVGLARATGEYCVIFDAEDRPQPDQLRRTVEAFEAADPDIECLQARLEYWNPNTNLLTKLFTAEYAMNFSLYLPGLVAPGWPVPLGGTSNHFRTETLRRLGGWDPYNVTEDADLGIWLSRQGYRVGLVDSVTWEEANSNVANWLRQRSRWLKGYMQTWFVHMRSPRDLLRELGLGRFLAFQVVVGGTWLTSLVNPLFWTLTLAYAFTGSSVIRDLFPAPMLYAGTLSFVVGNWLFGYTLLLGAMERKLYGNVKWMLLAPLYWALMSVAAYKAAAQLARRSRRFYWEKTDHGLVVAAEASA